MGTQLLDIDDAGVEKALNNDSAGAASSNTVNGDWVDLQETVGVRFIAMAQEVTSGSVDLNLESADASDQSDNAAVPDKYLTRTEADLTLDAADEVVAIGYTGPERFVRVNAVESSFDGVVVGIAEKLPETNRPADTTTA